MRNVSDLLYVCHPFILPALFKGSEKRWQIGWVNGKLVIVTQEKILSCALAKP